MQREIRIAERKSNLWIKVAATRSIVAALVAITPAVCAGASLSYTEQIPVETFAKMREVERYQLKIAQKHYVNGDYKIALDEFDKFLTLYEKSLGAAYAQLMWSHSQVRLRKVNTAIRDGFQSVIDYWPNSHEASLAAYLIPKSYMLMGETEKAEKSFFEVINKHPHHLVATLASVDLLHMADVKKDDKRRLLILQQLTYKTERNDDTRGHAESASKRLAGIFFHQAKLDEAMRALETTYQGRDLVKVASDLGSKAASHLMRDEETKEDGLKLADAVIVMIEQAIPTDLSESKQREILRSDYYRIASIYGRTGREDEVLKIYQKMIRLLGEDDDLLGSIAGFYKRTGKRELARKTYRRFKDKQVGITKIAEMYREEGEIDLAVKTFFELEDEIVAHQAVAETYRGASRWDPAIETYRSLMTLDGDNADSYQWSIGGCYESSERYRSAISTYRQVDKFPDNYFQMAGCHRKLKEYKEAILLYNQCKVDETSAPKAQIYIAYTYEQAGEREKAIKSFQHTCRTYPKSGRASEAHAHLQSKYKISVTLGGAKDE